MGSSKWKKENLYLEEGNEPNLKIPIFELICHGCKKYLKIIFTFWWIEEKGINQKQPDWCWERNIFPGGVVGGVEAEVFGGGVGEGGFYLFLVT